jgi:hypothetical protein
MSANTYQHGGTHYVEQQIQPWDFIVSNDLGFLEGNIIKYLARYKLKNLENGGIDDLHKAYHYLTKLMRSPMSETAKMNVYRKLQLARVLLQNTRLNKPEKTSSQGMSILSWAISSQPSRSSSRT